MAVIASGLIVYQHFLIYLCIYLKNLQNGAHFICHYNEEINLFSLQQLFLYINASVIWQTCTCILWRNWLLLYFPNWFYMRNPCRTDGRGDGDDDSLSIWPAACYIRKTISDSENHGLNDALGWNMIHMHNKYCLFGLFGQNSWRDKNRLSVGRMTLWRCNSE